MGRRRKSKNNDGFIILAFIIGIPVFLMFEYPIIFLLIFVPVVTVAVINFITWLKGRK